MMWMTRKKLKVQKQVEEKMFLWCVLLPKNRKFKTMLYVWQS